MNQHVLLGALGGFFLSACTSNDVDTEGPDGSGSASAAIACSEPGEGDEIQEFDAMKLYFEFQSTDNDTGIHGLMGMSGWQELCVYNPDGEQIIANKPQGTLKELGMADFFFESREPANDDISKEEILAMFPAGMYEMRGKAFDGTFLEGEAWLTHDLPRPPVITFPQEDDVVDPANFVVTWEPVIDTVIGDPVTMTAYEVIVTDDRDEAEDENGMAQPVASIHVPADVTSLSIPSEFLQPGIEYELEVIALEESGNQTITVVFFQTM